MDEARTRRWWQLVKRSSLPRVADWTDGWRGGADAMNTAELKRRLGLD